MYRFRFVGEPFAPRWPGRSLSDQVHAQTMANGLSPFLRTLPNFVPTIEARSLATGAVAFVLRYHSEREQGVDPHQALLNSAAQTLSSLGLAFAGGVVEELARHTFEGAAAGALGGLGISRKNPSLLPWLVLGGTLAGAAAGTLVERGVCLWEAQSHPYYGWLLNPVPAGANPTLNFQF